MLGIYLARFIFGYIKSAVLSAVVLPVLTALFMIGTALPEFPIPLARHLAFFGTVGSDGTVSLDSGDIMEAFSVFSLVVYGCTALLKRLGLVARPSLWRGIILILLPFIVAGTLIATGDVPFAEGTTGFRGTFLIILCLIAVAAYMVWRVLNAARIAPAEPADFVR